MKFVPKFFVLSLERVLGVGIVCHIVGSGPSGPDSPRNIARDNLGTGTPFRLDSLTAEDVDEEFDKNADTKRKSTQPTWGYGRGGTEVLL